MNRLTRILPILLFIVLFVCSKPKPKVTSISLEKGWKFKIGDNLEWAKPEFDDTDWSEIAPQRLWEAQGFEEYDGYAWYRIQVLIPSQLKQSALIKDSLQVFLGKIDDTEQTFLNGKLIGQNTQYVPLKNAETVGTFEGNREAYSWVRRYSLSANDQRIRWDEVNTIAIRVHDHGGGGGLYSTDQRISMVDIQEYVHVDALTSAFKKSGEEKYSKKIILNNASRKHDFEGEFNIQVIQEASQKKIFEEAYNIRLVHGRNYDFDFD